MIPKSATAGSAMGRPLSRADEAAALGVSRQHLWRLRKAEEQGRAAWATAGDNPREVEQLPHVPIVDRPAGRGWCYVLGAEGASRLPAGPMRIGSGGPDRTSPHRGAARPGRLEGRLRVHHRDEVLGERESERRPAPSFRPRRPPRKKEPPP